MKVTSSPALSPAFITCSQKREAWERGYTESTSVIYLAHTPNFEVHLTHHHYIIDYTPDTLHHHYITHLIEVFGFGGGNGLQSIEVLFGFVSFSTLCFVCCLHLRGIYSASHVKVLCHKLRAISNGEQYTIYQYDVM